MKTNRAIAWPPAVDLCYNDHVDNASPESLWQRSKPSLRLSMKFSIQTHRHLVFITRRCVDCNQSLNTIRREGSMLRFFTVLALLALVFAASAPPAESACCY